MEQLPSEAYQLGTPLSVHKRALRVWVGGGVLVFFLVLIGLALLGGAVGGQPVLALIAVPLLGLAGWIVYRAVCKPSLRVVVAPNGLVALQGAKVLLFPWDDVSSVTQAITQHYTNGVRTRKEQKYRVLLRNGARLSVNENLTDIDALGRTIQQQVTQRLLPHAAESFSAGETVVFGRLRVSRAGVSKDGTIYPWSELGRLTFAKGDVCLSRRNGRGVLARVPVAQTPNVFVLQGLVNWVLEGAARRV